MKNLLTLLLCLSGIPVIAQSESPLQLDSLKRLLSAATTDTGKVILMANLASGYGYSQPDSYDVIEAHGGDIKVDTKEGDFTEFVIQIPRIILRDNRVADESKQGRS